MSERPVHWRRIFSLAVNGSRSIVREAHSARNEYVDRVEYVVYRSISAPTRISPREVCEMYTSMSADATIRSRIGAYGSVTNAWSGGVGICSRTPPEGAAELW